MREFEALARKAEKDFDLGEFARAVRACRSYRRFDARRGQRGKPHAAALSHCKRRKRS